MNFKRGGSYIDSSDWIKIRKTTNNPINKNGNKCFQYAITVALNHEEIEKNPERIAKIKPFVDNYNWEGINYPSEKVDWEKFDKNNPTSALNILYAKKENLCPAYVLKHDSNREKLVFLLMIPNGEGRHSIVVKILPASLTLYMPIATYVVLIHFDHF